MIHHFEALGTQWWITLFEEPETADVIFADIGRFVSEYEARYSRFKPDSLISTLNRERVLKNPDEDFRTLLSYGKQLFMRTGERFNILTGHILEARGYNSEYSFKETDSEALTPGNPITDLLISEEKIELTHGNVDVGGYGKGYLIDLLAGRLQDEHRLQHFLINGGGDMYGTSENGEPIEIKLAHPTIPNASINRTNLLNQGFAASSPHLRSWGTTNHIVGTTLTDAVYVKAEKTVDADAFATTFLMTDPTYQNQLCEQERLGLARFSVNEGHFTTNRAFIENIL